MVNGDDLFRLDLVVGHGQQRRVAADRRGVAAEHALGWTGYPSEHKALADQAKSPTQATTAAPTDRSARRRYGMVRRLMR